MQHVATGAGFNSEELPVGHDGTNVLHFSRNVHTFCTPGKQLPGELEYSNHERFFSRSKNKVKYFLRIFNL